MLWQAAIWGKLAYGFRGHSPSWWRKDGSGHVRQLVMCICCQKQRGELSAWLTFSFLFFSVQDSRPGVDVAHTWDRNPPQLKIWKHPHRRIQRCISLVILSLIQLTMKINYYKRQKSTTPEPQLAMSIGCFWQYTLVKVRVFRFICCQWHTRREWCKELVTVRSYSCFLCMHDPLCLTINSRYRLWVLMFPMMKLALRNIRSIVQSHPHRMGRTRIWNKTCDSTF